MRYRKFISILICMLFVAGTFAGIPAAASEKEYITADMAGFDSYTRVILAMVGISGAKSPQPVSVTMPGEVEGKSVRVTAIAVDGGDNSFSISSCRAPDASFADQFKDGAHLNPTASGKTYNVFDGAVLTDSVGIRFCVATGPSDSVAAFAGKARLQFGITPSRGRSTADNYSEYEEGFVFETPDYDIGADGFVNVLFEDAAPVDGRTPADADFINDYLPLVNAVNVIVTPDAAIVDGDFYYIGGFRAYRERREYDVYASADDVCGRTVTISGISEHEGELALEMDGKPMPVYYEKTVRTDSYGLNRVEYLVDTAAAGDGSHAFRLLLDGECVCEKAICFDNTLPYIAYSSVVQGSARAANGVIDMRAADGESGVRAFSVRLDGAAISLPYSYSGLAEGAHSVTYSITDYAGMTKNGSIIFNVSGGVTYGDFTAAGGAASVNVSGANGKKAYAYSVGGELPVTAYENSAQLDELAQKSPAGENGFTGRAKTVTLDEKYPYQAFDVDVTGVTGDEIYVSASAAANIGETLRLSVYNETEACWQELARARMEANSVALSAAAPLADCVSEGKMKFRISLLSVDNGADTFTWCTDAQHMIQHNYEDGTYRDYTYYIREQFELFIEEYGEGKIGYVLNTGDISDEPNNAAMFAECREYSNILDNASIPNGVVAGNHDANWTNWCPYYGAKYYDYQDWWGGDYKDNRGHYDLVTIGGRDLVVVCLGWTLENDNEATAWARRVFNAYPNRTGILATHGYLGTDGEILYNTARKFWAIAEDCPNVAMIMCGHEPGTARNIRYTTDGRPVLEMLHDYQSGSPANNWWKWLEGGSGLFRYVTIKDGTITNRTFTASKDDYIRVYKRNPDTDGGYYYWDLDEENYTMPVRLIDNERRVETFSFTARTVSEGAQVASANVSGGKASFAGLPEGLWYVVCEGVTSAVYPTACGSAPLPVITGAYGANNTLLVRWELPANAAADGFIVRADGETVAELDGDAREYTGSLSRAAGESARICVVAVNGEGSAVSENRDVVFSGVTFTAEDIDEDGEVTVADALAALRMSVGLYEGVTAKRWFAADSDGDGDITVSDALRILRRAAGLM